MAKRPQSIDGFILTPRSNNPQTQGGFEDRRVRPTLDTDESASVKIQQKGVISEPMTPTRKTAALEPNREEIDQSLNSIADVLDDNRAVLPNKITKRQKRREKKQNQLKKKPHHVRKLVKRLIIVAFAMLLATIIFLVAKSLMTGGKIFQGNILDIVTSKTRLIEDENGRTNVLVFGTSGYTMSEDAWDGALLTDSIMVLSVDQDEHNAYMISLPRDLYVKYGTACPSGYEGKLNAVYTCGSDGDSDKAAGAEMFKSIAGQILGVDIQYYVHANWTALRDTVNAVGGVDVEIDSANQYGIFDCNTNLKLSNGEHHLDGDQALALARARGDADMCTTSYGLAGGNFDREKNQQKILVSLQSKALSVGTLANPATVSSLLDAMGDNLRTNFKTSEVQTLIDLAKNIKSNNIISLPLVGRDNGADLVTTGMINSASVVIPVAGTHDYSDIRDYVRQNLSSNPVTREAAVIDILNGSNVGGLAQGKADELENSGFIIGQVDNAPDTVSTNIKIYQINLDKTATADALAKKYNVTVEKGELVNYSTEADFVVVFGDGAS